MKENMPESLKELKWNIRFTDPKKKEQFLINLKAIRNLNKTLNIKEKTEDFLLDAMNDKISKLLKESVKNGN